MNEWWANSKVHYEAAYLLGRRHTPKVGVVVKLRRLYWIFVRGYEYEICDLCGRPVGHCTGSWWHADDELWLEINGRSGGVMCPPCFTSQCEKGGYLISWKAVIERG